MTRQQSAAPFFFPGTVSWHIRNRLLECLPDLRLTKPVVPKLCHERINEEIKDGFAGVVPMRIPTLASEYRGRL